MRRTTLGVALGLGVATVAAVGWAMAARPGSAELAVETVLRLKVAAAVLGSEVREGQTFPGPHGAFVPLTVVREGLHPQHRSLLGDSRDAWGRPLIYWSDGDRFLLLSYGADGIPEAEYAGPAPWTLVTQGAPSDPDADILVVDGELWRGPGTSRDNLRRVMSSLRSVATAMEAYSIDFSFYPDSSGFEAVQVLESTLEPVYIKNMPLTDPWERSLWVWSALDSYALVTYGSDGEPEFPYASWQASDWNTLDPRGTSEPGQDMILVNGQFVRWPATLPR